MKAVQVILILALLLCLFPMPYGYFILVRYFGYICFCNNGISVLQTTKQSDNLPMGVSSFIVSTIFLRLHWGREIWNVVDIVVAIILVIVV